MELIHWDREDDDGIRPTNFRLIIEGGVRHQPVEGGEDQFWLPHGEAISARLEVPMTVGNGDVKINVRYTDENGQAGTSMVPAVMSWRGKRWRGGDSNSKTIDADVINREKYPGFKLWPEHLWYWQGTDALIPRMPEDEAGVIHRFDVILDPEEYGGIVDDGPEAVFAGGEEGLAQVLGPHIVDWIRLEKEEPPDEGPPAQEIGTALGSGLLSESFSQRKQKQEQQAYVYQG